MSENNTASALAKAWIDGWNAGQPDQIPLAEDFAHTSPFGTIEGREKYLEIVKPLAQKNVQNLTIRRLLGGEGEAVIWFEMATPNGTVAVCEWIQTNDNQITSIHSFYDPRHLPTGTEDVGYE